MNRAARLLALALLIERIILRVGRLAGWLALPLMAVIVLDVALRHFIVIGSTRLQELEWHLHGLLFLLLLGATYLRGGHVRIELWHERRSPRGKAWIECLGIALLLIPWCLAILWFGGDYAALAYHAMEGSPSPAGLPFRFLIKSMLVVGFLLLMAAGVARMIRAGLFLFGPAAIRDLTGFGADNAVQSHMDEDRT